MTAAPGEGGLVAVARQKFRPRIRTVLLFINSLILLLPLVGIQALKLYENELIHQTEAALAAQGAYVREQLKADLTARLVGLGAPQGHEVDPRFVRQDGSSGEFYEPLMPDINVYRERIRPAAPDARLATVSADPLLAAAAAPLSPLLLSAQRFTLTGVRVLDHQGVVVASSRGEIGFSFADREEVQRALLGETLGLMRERVSDEPIPALSGISRGSRVRVFLALPVVVDNRVLGAIILSRTPLDIQKALYLQRFVLLRYVFGLMIIVLFVSLLTAKTISRPIEALIAQADAVKVGRASKPVEKPGSREVDELSRAIDAMARTLKERGAYIEAFARNVSHEFKTPLATFQGTVELLRDHAETMSRDERERFLGMIASDAARLERLVERLLHLARADVAAPAAETTPVAPTLEAAVRRAAEQGLKTALRIEPGFAPRAALSREALESIVSNLLENAKAHGGPDVRVDVRLSPGVQGTCVILVADDGPGISAANRTRVFDAFFTTARAAGGTGLGLAIVRALAEAHGGRVELEDGSTGAAFSVFLPAVDS